MKIWLVKAGEALPSDKPKDRLKRMGLLAEELVKKRHHVTWFNSSFNHSRKVQRSNKDKTIKVSNDYQIKLIWSNSYKNVSFARIKHHIQTGNKFKELIYTMEKPDIILCSMPTIELAEEAVKYGNNMNVPVIIDIRDLWPDIFGEILPSYARMFIRPYVKYSRKRLEKLLSRAYGITALTKEYLDWALNYAKRPITDNDRVFNMAYKNETYKSHKTDKEWDSIKTDDFVVCFFGHLGRQFNLEPVINAAKLLKKESGIKFVICGNGESLSDLKKITKDMKNITFPGWVNQIQIQSLLEISSVGIAPYRNSMNFTKNVPNKFGEYLSAGLPILVGLDGAMKRLVEKNKCGIMYKDGKELADIIVELKNDNDYIKHMKRNALNLYQNEFNSKYVYADMVKFLEEIVSKEKNKNAII